MWISMQKSQRLTFSNLVPSPRTERRYWKLVLCADALKIIWGFQTKLTESTSRLGRLRNEKDKNSSAVDGSILKSSMNKGFPLKEEKRGSGMESVSPCRFWADLWLHKGRSCQDWQRFIQTCLWFCTSSDKTDPILAKMTTSLIHFVKLKRELWESNVCSFFLAKKSSIV